MFNDGRIMRLTFLGGALGSLMRFAVGAVLGDLISLIIVNLLGAALLGWLNANNKYDNGELSALWKTGFAGGFTTMSGVATVLYFESASLGLMSYALGFLFLGLGLAAYWFAFVISRKQNQ